jgi:integrase
MRLLLTSWSDTISIVGEAADGEEALPLVRLQHPDMVICDLLMPRLNGLELTRRIKHERPQTKVILMTSYMKAGQRVAHLSEADAVVNKLALHSGLLPAVRAAHLPKDLQAVFEVAYVTGWRVKSELIIREWSHVDFKAGWLRLEPGETKNGDGRMFPLTPMLRTVLERQRDRTETFQRTSGQIHPAVFHRSGQPIKSFRRAWLSACRRAALTGRIPHDFRRTAVRNLERAGVPRSTAMRMVGHKTETIYRRYAIADEAMLKEGGVKLQTLHQGDQVGGPVVRTVIPINEASARP